MGFGLIYLPFLLTLATSGSGQINFSPVSAKAKLSTFAVETNIQFRYARTSVHLEAVNPSTKPQQFPFSLTLPEAAFVMNMSLTYDGEEHVARVEEKMVAKKQFQDAVNAGRTAAQVKGTVRDAQKVSVDVNIEPGETVVLVLTYEELLKRKVGRYEYSANINPGAIVDNFTVIIHLNESLPIKDLLVPDISDNTNDIGSLEATGNGQADVEKLEDSAALITYNPTRLDQESFGSEGIASKFIVEYDVERDNEDSIVQVMDGYFVHFFAPGNEKPLPKHIIFVLDTSGSMHGTKMDQLKNAMVTILEEVTAKDYLSIISFSDETAVWKSASQNSGSLAVEGVQQVKNEASRYILQLEAIGGTNINMALLEAIKVAENLKKNGGGGAKATPIIFFLTDGKAFVGETKSKNILINVVDRNIGEEVKVPIFSLAFGSDADFNLLKDISLKNLGFAKKIYEGTDADIQLEGFYQTIATPLLKNVKFEYVGDVWERSSLSDGNTPTFFLGTETIVVGKLNSEGASNDSESGILVAGEGVDGIIYENLIELGDISNVTTESSINFMERLWAFKTIKRLLSIAPLQAGISNTSQSKDPRKQALALSLRYNFVTELTSLIVTKPGEDEAAVKPVPVSTDAGSNFDGQHLLGGLTTRSHNPSRQTNSNTPYSPFNVYGVRSIDDWDGGIDFRSSNSDDYYDTDDYYNSDDTISTRSWVPSKPSQSTNDDYPVVAGRRNVNSGSNRVVPLTVASKRPQNIFGGISTRMFMPRMKSAIIPFSFSNSDYEYYDLDDYYGSDERNVKSGSSRVRSRPSFRARTSTRSTWASSVKPSQRPTTVTTPPLPRQTTSTSSTTTVTTTTLPRQTTSTSSTTTVTTTTLPSQTTSTSSTTTVTTTTLLTSCSITIFSQTYSNGDSVTFAEDQENLGAMDNKLWSLRIEGSCCWRVFADANFRGKYKDFCNGVYNTATDVGHIFKDASSVKLIH